MSAFESFIRPDDTLRFKLFVQKIIPQEDARITVEVHALVGTAQNDQSAIEQKIRAVLNEFIEVDWAFSTIRRDGDAVGYERVTLNASARVRIAAIFNLEERARRASKEGLSLKHSRVDYSLPSQRISDTVQELRKKIVEDVKVQIIEFDQSTGRSWRIGDIAFGLKNVSASRGTSKGAYRASDEYLADEDIFSDWDNAGVTSAERISLVAEVTPRTRSAKAQHIWKALSKKWMPTSARFISSSQSAAPRCSSTFSNRSFRYAHRARG